MSRPEVTKDEVVRLVVHGAMYPALADWLESQEFEVVELPLNEDEMRTLMVGLGPRRAAMLHDLL